MYFTLWIPLLCFSGLFIELVKKHTMLYYSLMGLVIFGTKNNFLLPYTGLLLTGSKSKTMQSPEKIQKGWSEGVSGHHLVQPTTWSGKSPTPDLVSFVWPRPYKLKDSQKVLQEGTWPTAHHKGRPRCETAACLFLLLLSSSGNTAHSACAFSLGRLH